MRDDRFLVLERASDLGGRIRSQRKRWKSTKQACAEYADPKSGVFKASLDNSGGVKQLLTKQELTPGLLESQQQGSRIKVVLGVYNVQEFCLL